MRAGAFRGATSWEAQIGRLWVRINFPQYWLFSRKRADFFRRTKGVSFVNFRAVMGPPRGWLFNRPGSIGWDNDQ